jgi:hypothetical protein
MIAAVLNFKTWDRAILLSKREQSIFIFKVGHQKLLRQNNLMPEKKE